MSMFNAYKCFTFIIHTSIEYIKKQCELFIIILGKNPTEMEVYKECLFFMWTVFKYISYNGPK